MALRRVEGQLAAAWNGLLLVTGAWLLVLGSAHAAVPYFIHTDHLDTPRVIANSSSQIVWRWDNLDPFGANAANENPSGLGVFTCNLRLPGQYFDQETNLHYNYQRDGYDPAIGRYIQSDPIGLFGGGVSTYAYAASNPISKFDPTGESWVHLLPVVGVGVGLYCYITITQHCQRSHPNHKDPLHPDRQKFLKCMSDWSTVVTLGLGPLLDPIGSAGQAVGEGAARGNCDSCQ